MRRPYNHEKRAKGFPEQRHGLLMVVCCFQPAMLKAVNDLAARDGVSTAEAVRRLVARGLRADINDTHPAVTIEIPTMHHEGFP